jgi:hypothetical protein
MNGSEPRAACRRNHSDPLDLQNRVQFDSILQEHAWDVGGFFGPAGIGGSGRRAWMCFPGGAGGGSAWRPISVSPTDRRGISPVSGGGGSGMTRGGLGLGFFFMPSRVSTNPVSGNDRTGFVRSLGEGATAMRVSSIPLPRRAVSPRAVKWPHPNNHPVAEENHGDEGRRAENEDRLKGARSSVRRNSKPPLDEIHALFNLQNARRCPGFHVSPLPSDRRLFLTRFEKPDPRS